MKTLKEIKDEVSKELGYKSYIHCYQETDRQEYEDLMDEVIRLCFERLDVKHPCLQEREVFYLKFQMI